MGLTPNRRHRAARLLFLAVLVLGPSAGRAMLAQDSKPAAEEIVSFNVHSLKYHCQTCTWAKRCTRNCISIPLSEAKRRGGVPCKVCGGSCRR